MTVGHIYTPRLEQAIQKAVQVHKHQIRRTPDEMPYITHLISVFTILLSYTRDEDVLIAGLMHDAIEDTSYTFEELEADFGKRVRNIVAGVTETKEMDGQPLPWKARKLSNVKNFNTCKQESLLVGAVDKIYNLNALIQDYEIYGDSLWDFLSPGPEEKLWFHRKVIDVFEEKLENKRLLEAVKEVYQRAHETFLLEECPNCYKPQSREKEKREVLSPLQRLSFSKRQAKEGGRPLLLGTLSARIFGYGKRNTN